MSNLDKDNISYAHSGALERKRNAKNLRLLWKWVGGSRSHSEWFFLGKPSQNSPKPELIFWGSIPCVFQWPIQGPPFGKA